MRFVAYACVLGIFLSFAAFPLDSGLSLGSYSAVVILQKDVRFQPVIKAAPPSSFPLERWIADWASSFLKVDRKQNLRLWPVVASGITRSPPLA
jgi:hypothetical protein